MKIDRERLDWVRKNHYLTSTRGIGRTFASCCDCCEAILSGSTHIQFRIPRRRWASHIIPMFLEIAREYGVEVIDVRRERIVTETAVVAFILPPRNLSSRSSSYDYVVETFGEGWEPGLPGSTGKEWERLYMREWK